MKKNSFILFFTLFYALTVNCQDIHFSQFYSSPLFLNPALTGSSSCMMRAGLNYRNQWKSVTVPYTTESAYIDGKIMPKVLGDDWLGLGAMFYNDNAGDGNLKSIRGMAFASYNKILNSKKSLVTSVGIGLGMVNKSVNYDKLLFNNQWIDGVGWDNSLPNNESIADNSISYFDINAGAVVTYSEPKSSKINFRLGISLSHLKKPNETFYGDNSELNKLGTKTIIHGEMSLKVKEKLYIRPKFMFSTQKAAQEIIFGTNISGKINENVALYGGLWTRLPRDIIPVVGLEYNKFLVLFSYDINYSKLQPASNGMGGLEVSIKKDFLCNYKRSFSKVRRIECPSFE